MCGIAGYITNKKYLNFSFDTASKKLKKIMKNRGPDQQGSFCYSKNNYIINLFSSRLSIIDLDSRSNQPLKLTIAFSYLMAKSTITLKSEKSYKKKM